jgi:hypothetical protein
VDELRCRFFEKYSGNVDRKIAENPEIGIRFPDQMRVYDVYVLCTYCCKAAMTSFQSLVRLRVLTFERGIGKLGWRGFLR